MTSTSMNPAISSQRAVRDAITPSGNTSTSQVTKTRYSGPTAHPIEKMSGELACERPTADQAKPVAVVRAPRPRVQPDGDEGDADQRADDRVEPTQLGVVARRGGHPGGGRQREAGDPDEPEAQTQAHVASTARSASPESSPLAMKPLTGSSSGPMSR